MYEQIGKFLDYLDEKYGDDILGSSSVDKILEVAIKTETGRKDIKIKLQNYEEMIEEFENELENIKEGE